MSIKPLLLKLAKPVKSVKPIMINSFEPVANDSVYPVCMM